MINELRMRVDHKRYESNTAETHVLVYFWRDTTPRTEKIIFFRERLSRPTWCHRNLAAVQAVGKIFCPRLVRSCEEKNFDCWKKKPNFRPKQFFFCLRSGSRHSCIFLGLLKKKNLKKKQCSFHWCTNKRAKLSKPSRYAVLIEKGSSCHMLHQNTAKRAKPSVKCHPRRVSSALQVYPSNGVKNL